MVDKLIIFLSLTIFLLGTYLVWFDKKNIFNHLLIGFCFIAYVIPSFLIDFDFFASPSTVRLYVLINLCASISFTAGIILGYKWRSILIVDSVMKFSIVENAMESDAFETKVLRLSKVFYIGSLIVLVLCFIYMGYIPMFADDPYSAKQFKGVYNARYQPVALFYRTAKQFIQFLMPFFFIDFIMKKRLNSFLLIFIGLVLIFVTLSRSETIGGILLTLSIIVSLKKGRTFFFFYLLFLILVFSVGSSFWTIAAYYFPDTFTNLSGEGLTTAEIIASGAPDIVDQLSFMEAFVKNHVDFTYGLTFLGGLIPFNFKYNTSAWTLMVLNDTNDISEIASGGLRLPVSLWGYVNFGWIGVVLLPFFSAFFTGYLIKKIKRFVNRLKANYKGYFVFYYLAFIYINIGYIFTDFYRISIYSFPAFIFYGLVIYFVKPKKIKAGNINVATENNA